MPVFKTIFFSVNLWFKYLVWHRWYIAYCFRSIREEGKNLFANIQWSNFLIFCCNLYFYHFFHFYHLSFLRNETCFAPVRWSDVFPVPMNELFSEGFERCWAIFIESRKNHPRHLFLNVWGCFLQCWFSTIYLVGKDDFGENHKFGQEIQ